MTYEQKEVEFLKFLHEIEQREVKKGLFKTDGDLVAIELREKFLTLFKRTQINLKKA